MRFPVAPAQDPPADNVSTHSAFFIGRLLGVGRIDDSPAQRAANQAARHEGWEDTSQLVENIVAGFAQRCDRLMSDMGLANEAPGFFTPLRQIAVYEAGLRNEQWMVYWSKMRERS